MSEAKSIAPLQKRLRAVIPYQGKSEVAFLCHEAADVIEALVAALEDTVPWVEEWAEISDYPPGIAKMQKSIRDARTALSLTHTPGDGQ